MLDHLGTLSDVHLRTNGGSTVPAPRTAASYGSVVATIQPPRRRGHIGLEWGASLGIQRDGLDERREPGTA